MRALVALLLLLLAVPGSTAAMTLMTEDSRVFDDLKGSPLAEQGYTVAEQMGVRMMRYHRGLEGGVDRETGAVGPPDVPLYFARVDGWLNDVLRRGFRPYLAISVQPGSYVDMPSVEAYGRWCGDVAARYGDRISRFAVWNEPNNGLWGPLLVGKPALYNRLYRACYAAVKSATGGVAKVYYGEIDAHTADPCAWVENSLDDGGTTLADGIAIHTYQWRTPPDRPAGTYCQGIGRLDDWNAEKRSWAERGLLRAARRVPGGRGRRRQRDRERGRARQAAPRRVPLRRVTRGRGIQPLPPLQPAGCARPAVGHRDPRRRDRGGHAERLRTARSDVVPARRARSRPCALGPGAERLSLGAWLDVDRCTERIGQQVRAAPGRPDRHCGIAAVAGQRLERHSTVV